MAAGTNMSTDGAEGLAALAARASALRGETGRGLPPVDRWDPPFCGEIDMEIKDDGSWTYMGSPIARAALVRLFSTVLRKDEDGRTYLVTPVEKLAIRVADAPFLAVEMALRDDPTGGKLVFRTNLGDLVEAGAEHPLRFTGGFDAWCAYLHVRGRLEAKLSRALMYDLAELGEVLEHEGRAMFCIRSGGAVFPVMPAEDLDAAT